MGKLRILLADPADADRKELAAAIGSVDEEIQLVEAADGASVMARLPDSAPEIILISQRLGGLDGPSFVRWLEGSGRKSLCALLSDQIKGDWARVATCVNAYDVFKKPVTSEALSHLIRSYKRMALPARVALFSDSPAVADVITGLMGRSRFSLAADRFTTAHKGAAAFRSRSYDLAIIDQVSDVPALEAVVQLQAQSKGTAFVLLGTEPEEVIRAALSAFGISAYLCKPFGTPTASKMPCTEPSGFGGLTCSTGY